MMFLPISKDEMLSRGWDQVDVALVTGDAYVDHPAFGTAIISRVLEAAGLRVGIIAQPQNDADFCRFGRPRLAFYINSGNIDSMVAHYTVAKRRRTTDYFSPGGQMGKRPDRACVVYSRTAKRVYPDVPVAIGGLEASLRRFAHYDYWKDRVLPSILIDSGADLLMFGMGENTCVEIAGLLAQGWDVKDITHVRGTACAVPADYPYPEDYILCPSFEEASENSKDGRKAYAVSVRLQQREHDPIRGRGLVQRHGDLLVVQNPPAVPLCTAELDRVAELPYERNYHPVYEASGGIPAINEVKFSITHNRGCFGACNFCAIEYHQGRFVTSRSKESLLREARLLTRLEGFKGYIHDVGGPTANFRSPSCERQLTKGLCPDRKCLAPHPCPNLRADHSEYLDILRSVRKLDGVKKVFIRSGIRYDYLLCDGDGSFFAELVKHHVSGQLRVAPEHCSAAVLSAMGKPSIEVYRQFKKKFDDLSLKAGLRQFVVPYLMSSHPGSRLRDAVELACFLKSENLHPEQVQDFYPTPGTVSTCMYYTGLDPVTMKPVYVASDPREKAMQRALLQYYLPQNREKVMEALKKAGREDLIGFGPRCLVRPFFAAGSKDRRKAAADGKRPKKKTSLTKHINSKKGDNKNSERRKTK